MRRRACGSASTPVNQLIVQGCVEISGKESVQLYRRREDITAATYCLDQHRVLRIVAELAPETPYLHVDGAVERARLAVARQVEQPVAAQDLIRIGDEGS